MPASTSPFTRSTSSCHYDPALLFFRLMDYSNLYKDVNQISMKWDKTEFSKDVVINRMYVRLEDLDVTNGSGMLQGYEKVKKLYIFADVVELPPSSKKTRLPGSDRVVIVCRLLYAPSSNKMYVNLPNMSEQFPRSRLTSNPPRGVDVQVTYRNAAVSDILGVTVRSIEFSFTTGSSVPPATITFNIEPGTGYTGLNIATLGSHGNFWILDMGSGEKFPQSPLEVLNDTNVLLGMQSTMLIAELVQTANYSADLFAAVREHVSWLSTILVQVKNMDGASTKKEHLDLLFRAQTFLKMTPRRGVVVPRLQYHKYKNLITLMVDVAQRYDQDFKQLKLFIEQNRILGSYLLQQNKAFAAKEREMDDYHSQILSLTRTELDSTMEKMDKLNVQMDEQSKEMEKAKDDMDAGLVEYQNKQLANALFAVLGALASISLAFVTGGATAPGAVAAAGNAVNAAGQVAQGLKKVVEILEDLQKVMEVVKIIKDLIDAIEEIGELVNAPEMPEMPTDADWEIFVNEVEAVAEIMPTEVTEVPAWKAKCKNVAALGKEINTTAAHIVDLMYRIKTEELLQEIAKNQADRLESIEAADLTNYMEMATQIDMRTTKVLLELIKVLYIQDPALKYEYLQKPVALNAWPVSMQTVYNLLIQQETIAIDGLHNLGTPVEMKWKYTVKDIPISLLKEGKDWSFEIPMEAIQNTWSRVRIRYLEMQFGDDSETHKPKTDSDQVYVLLQSSRFFRDRRLDEVMDYEAGMGIQFPYAYDLETGNTTLPNEPSPEFADMYMRMTPFSQWLLRLSKSAYENQGLAFPTATSPGSTTQISITFYLTISRKIDTKLAAEEE